MHRDQFFIGVDACSANVVKYSAKIYKKPSRGGLLNALYIHAIAEVLPYELNRIANRVTVHFPWGSLLSALVQPDLTVLRGIRRICVEGATLEITLGYDLSAEPGEMQRLKLPRLTPEYLEGRLRDAYQRAGFCDFCWEKLDKASLKALSTSWAKRLAYGKDRVFYRITARAGDPFTL
jgi:16S rRNA (adenine(1408)-N(1))-methyltransferase